MHNGARLLSSVITEVVLLGTGHTLGDSKRLSLGACNLIQINLKDTKTL